MLRILVNFLDHQLQHELPQTQGLLVYLSYYEKSQDAKTDDQVSIKSLNNSGNPGRLKNFNIFGGLYTAQSNICDGAFIAKIGSC